VVGKLVAALLLAAAALLVASQWPDITRYAKIRRLSSGRGHPESVPAGGRKAYPQR
jgi:hypothetical protein